MTVTERQFKSEEEDSLYNGRMSYIIPHLHILQKARFLIATGCLLLILDNPTSFSISETKRRLASEYNIIILCSLWYKASLSEHMLYNTIHSTV